MLLAVVSKFDGTKLSDQGWEFGGFESADIDNINDTRFVYQLYTNADSDFTGWATVPVLQDKKSGTIISNECVDILRILNRAFAELVSSNIDLFPKKLASNIDTLKLDLYENLNNRLVC